MIGGKDLAKSVRISNAANVIGLTLVLTLLGAATWGILKLKEYRKSVVEQTELSIFLNNSVEIPEMTRLEKELEQEKYILSVEPKTQEDVEKEMPELFDDDDLGNNSIPLHLLVKFDEGFIITDSLNAFKERVLHSYPDLVSQVSYNEERVKNIESTNKTPLIYILVFAGLMLIIAVALISNTIRLSLYSRRFAIKTMALVGAKPSFIRRPYMVNAFIQGILAGILAVSFLVSLVYMLNYLKILDASNANLIDINSFLIIFGALVGLGVIISWFSTFWVLRKFTRLRSDQLY